MHLLAYFILLVNFIPIAYTYLPYNYILRTLP